MRKFFSLFAAVLFAGSMMAAEPYTLKFGYYDSTSGDKGQAETELAGLFDSTSMAYLSTDGAVLDKVYLGRKYKDKETGDSIFSNVKFGTSSAAGTLTFALKDMSVDSIIFRAAMYGDSEGGDGFSVNGTQFTLSAGNKTFENLKYIPTEAISSIEIKQTKASKGRFYLTSITVYPGEGGVTPPEPIIVPKYYLVGSMNGWQAAEAYQFKANPKNEGEYMVAATLAEKDSIKVLGVAGEVTTWYPDHAANYVIDAEHAGDVTVYFRPEGNVEGWYEGFFYVEPVVVPEAVVIPSCQEAADTALTVSKNNELLNDGQLYIVRGYVTNIAFAWKEGSMSFWMADSANGGKVLEAYKCAIEKEEDAVRVGDLVEVTGALTKYNTTPEFATGCTVNIIERAEVIEPKNLGDKTIAEFLELKNTVDTCILTGVVDSIINTTYGNLYLSDETGQVYVYGVLTADGESKKFAELGVEVGDILTIKALYNEYQGAPQVKNAIFVEVKKAPQPVEMQTLYLKPGPWYYEGNQEQFAMYAWGDGKEPIWSDFMELAENETDVWEGEIPADYTNVIFVRFGNAAQIPSWSDNMWSQTEDLAITEGYDMYTITKQDPYDAETGVNPKAEGFWSKYEHIVPAKFYILGLEGKWELTDLIPSFEDSYMAELEAGYYEMKVLADGTWETAKGYDDLTAVAEGLSKNETYGNICFTLAEAGNVTITYNDSVFTLAGNFYTGPEPETKYYLVGTITSWSVVAEDKYLFLANVNQEGVYSLDFTLAEGDGIKVVGVQGDKQTWYPDGMGNEYVVDAAHAGTVTILFSPEGGKEGWHEGYFTIETAQGIDNTNAAEKAVKVLINGQLIIKRNGVNYNLNGQVIR